MAININFIKINLKFKAFHLVNSNKDKKFN